MQTLNEALNESEKLITKQTNEKAIREQVQSHENIRKGVPVEKVYIADFFKEKIKQWAAGGDCQKVSELLWLKIFMKLL